MVTRITCMEICGNPKDLFIKIADEDEEGKFPLIISRGKGHNFKPLLSGPAPSKEDALEAIELILNAAVEQSDNEGCLTEQMVESIMQNLRDTSEVSTHDLLS